MKIYSIKKQKNNLKILKQYKSKKTLSIYFLYN